MGFSRNQIKAEAKKTFKGLEIDDVPGGTVTLRSPLALSDEEQAELETVEKRVQDLQAGGNGTFADLRSALKDQAVLLADRREGFADYLDDFGTDELVAVFSLYRKQVQAGEAKSGR